MLCNVLGYLWIATVRASTKLKNVNSNLDVAQRYQFIHVNEEKSLIDRNVHIYVR